jgi:hypothetical protein
MPLKLERYELRAISQEPQAVPMQRRARIVSVSEDGSRVYLFAEVECDEVTRAVDVRHVRHFVVIRAGSLIPEKAGIVAANGRVVVYEVRPA